MGFEPRYTITSRVARGLMRIEAARQAVAALPLNERVLAGFLVIANPSKRGRTYRLAQP